ncbi:hypothetical protein PR048_019270 [Dryococelus australis]|uniref:Uncharacterized protein n=1 Tax=Dryococelus australis TaxID=614101 RepID=A0ABQ9H308_9NEOP|nr:hypothetical protein PR048_019270 [Dryococelus australis]
MVNVIQLAKAHTTKKSRARTLDKSRMSMSLTASSDENSTQAISPSSHTGISGRERVYLMFGISLTSSSALATTIAQLRHEVQRAQDTVPLRDMQYFYCSTEMEIGCKEISTRALKSDHFTENSLYQAAGACKHAVTRGLKGRRRLGPPLSSASQTGNGVFIYGPWLSKAALPRRTMAPRVRASRANNATSFCCRSLCFRPPPEFKGVEERQIPEKTRRATASSGMIPTGGNSWSDSAGNRTHFVLLGGERTGRRHTTAHRKYNWHLRSIQETISFSSERSEMGVEVPLIRAYPLAVRASSTHCLIDYSSCCKVFPIRWVASRQVSYRALIRERRSVTLLSSGRHFSWRVQLEIAGINDLECPSADGVQRNEDGVTTKSMGRGGIVVRLLASHLVEPGSIPVGIAYGSLHVGIVLDDAAGGRVFSGISRFPRPCIPALLRAHLVSPSSAPKTSLRWGTCVFQQDGAPPHWHLAVRGYLNETLPQRWIGRGAAGDQALHHCPPPPKKPGSYPDQLFRPPLPANIDHLKTKNHRRLTNRNTGHADKSVERCRGGLVVRLLAPPPNEGFGQLLNSRYGDSR